MQGRTDTDLPLQAFLMAVWWRKPKAKVYVHSGQGSQFTGYEWQEFIEQHNLVPSMSRRGNCWDNTAAERCFNLLKHERIRRRKYKTREKSHPDVFALRRLQPIAYRPMDCIEFFTPRSANTSGTECCRQSHTNSRN
jgi:transposase InsO family protein